MTDPFGNPIVTSDPFNPVAQDDGPGAGGYVVGVILIILGVAGAIWWGVSHFVDFQDTIDDFQRVPVGRVGRIELDEGEYVVYAERNGGSAVGLYANNVESRPMLEFRPYTSEFTYDTGGRSGRAQQTFTVEDAGTYRVRAQELGSTATTVAFGPSVVHDLVSAIVGAIVIGLIGVGVGTILLIVTGVRRGRYRRRSWLAAAGQPGFGPPPGTWNPPGPDPGTYTPPPPSVL
jgi:hypothetical protein